MSKYIIVKLKKGKTTYEILSHHGAIEKWKENGKKENDWQHCLYSDEIFKNLSKGERPTKEELLVSFGDIDQKTILQIIASDGDIQLTQTDRKEILDNKRKAIITNINKNWVEPKTKKPYSIMQINSALTTIKAKIDMVKPIEEQVKLIMKDLILKLPMTKNTSIEGSLTIPNIYVGKVQSSLKKYCTQKKEKWTEYGWVVDVSLSSSEFDPLFQFLTKATCGDFQFISEADLPPQPNNNIKEDSRDKKNIKNNK